MTELLPLLWLSPSTPATGNDTTSRRICSFLSSQFDVRCLNSQTVGDPLPRFSAVRYGLTWCGPLQATLEDVRAECCREPPPRIVVAVHALRSGRLLGSVPAACSVVVLLAGTDVSGHMAPGTHCSASDAAIIQSTILVASVFVAFNVYMRDAFLAFVGARWPEARLPPVVVIPQSVSVTELALPTAGPELTPPEGVRATLGLPKHAAVFLQPCGLRAVKDPAFLIPVSYVRRMLVCVWMGTLLTARVGCCPCACPAGVCEVAPHKR